MRPFAIISGIAVILIKHDKNLATYFKMVIKEDAGDSGKLVANTHSYNVSYMYITHAVATYYSKVHYY